jgi:uncharacterized repeat protein (TIGR01451 family)
LGETLSEAMHSEERVNVDRRGLGTSRVRLLVAGLSLLAVGCAVLGLGSPSLQTTTSAVGSIDKEASSDHTLGLFSPLPITRKLIGAELGLRVQARNIFAGLPLIFEPNQGQANLDRSDPRSRFVAHGSGFSLLLGSPGAVLQLYSQDASQQGPSKRGSFRSAARVESLQMRLAGANPKAALTGADLLSGKSNYILGNDPAKWRRGIPQFARVRYEEVYPGINLVFYGKQGRLEYDFQLAPGADPAQAELEFDGAKQVELKDGALVIHGENVSVRLEAPRAYQEIAGREQPVAASFVLLGANRVGFAIGSYDRERRLVIDPVLSFSTYFGGTGDELNSSVAVDSAGNIYLAGSTNSPNLATTGVLQTALVGTRNVYVAKITPPSGSNAASLDYVTYLGGNGTDYPVGIGVDSSEQVYLAGTTTSTNFPTMLGYQSAPESPGNAHGFVTVLNSAAASLVYSTYLSGNGVDIASGMAIDSEGDVYVTGTTTSVETNINDQFPATNITRATPFQSTPRSSIQFFVTKVFTVAGGNGSILYSTYFGGGNFAGSAPVVIGGGVTVDTNGNIYFTGTTNFIYTGISATTDFPILNAYQPCLDQPPTTTIVGTPTCSNNTSSNPDAFVAKFANPNAGSNATEGGALLQWSTYLGGSQNDSGNGIALDPTGAANVYVVGTTNSPDFVYSGTLATLASYQKCLNNQPPTPPNGAVTCSATSTANDAFVARLSNPTSTSGTSATNVSLTYFSYLGGSADEAGLAITVDSANGALITGWTQSPSNFVLQGTTYVPQSGTFPVFPYPNAIQSTLNPTQDAFVARLNTAAATGQTTTASWANYFGGDGIGEGTGITLDTNGLVYFAGDTNSANLHVSEPLPSGANNNGGYDAFVTQLGTAASLSLTGVLTLGTNQTYISAGNQATFTYTLTNNGPDLATGIVVTDNLSPSVTGVPLTLKSASTGAGSCDQTTGTCTIPSLQANSTATITIVVVPAANSSGNPATFNGGTVRATAANGITGPQISVPGYVSDFTMTASPANRTVVAGNTASFTVQLLPHPVYGSSIALAVLGVPPAGTSSTFTTSSVTLQGTSGATSVLNISTTARPITTPVASLWTRPFYAIWLAVPGLALLGMGGGRRRKRSAGIVLFCLLFALLLLQPACSGTTTRPPVSGTPAGQYALTITASSGSDAKNYTVVLTVD